MSFSSSFSAYQSQSSFIFLSQLPKDPPSLGLHSESIFDSSEVSTHSFKYSSSGNASLMYFQS